ncbi:MAG: hypothetical protein Q6K26_09845, partial [Gloeomargarita sp. SZTDM-1c_bins_89]
MTLGADPYRRCPRCGYDRNPAQALRCEICNFALQKRRFPWGLVGWGLGLVLLGGLGYGYTRHFGPLATQPAAKATPARLQATLTGHTGYINTVVFTPDGRYLLSASEDKTIRVWEVTTGQAVRTL